MSRENRRGLGRSPRSHRSFAILSPIWPRKMASQMGANAVSAPPRPEYAHGGRWVLTMFLFTTLLHSRFYWIHSFIFLFFPFRAVELLRNCSSAPSFSMVKRTPGRAHRRKTRKTTPRKIPCVNWDWIHPALVRIPALVPNQEKHRRWVPEMSPKASQLSSLVQLSGRSNNPGTYGPLDKTNQLHQISRPRHRNLRTPLGNIITIITSSVSKTILDGDVLVDFEHHRFVTNCMICICIIVCSIYSPTTKTPQQLPGPCGVGWVIWTQLWYKLLSGLVLRAALQTMMMILKWKVPVTFTSVRLWERELLFVSQLKKNSPPIRRRANV